MTEDTKRALEIIAPMAKELRIVVQADDKFLYCNGQAIGIALNSTFATLIEFIGYVLAEVYAKQVGKLPTAYLSKVKRYWLERR